MNASIIDFASIDKIKKLFNEAPFKELPSLEGDAGKELCSAEEVQIKKQHNFEKYLTFKGNICIPCLHGAISSSEDDLKKHLNNCHKIANATFDFLSNINGKFYCLICCANAQFLNQEQLFEHMENHP